ncbi:hypothetical protein ABIF65_003278 [Bradyrhizobium japonicum]
MRKISGLAFCLTLLSAPALGASGDNGGPGYRNQAGKCVGWEALARQCGNPPSTKCTPENVAEGSQDAAAKGATIRSLMDRSHERSQSSAIPAKP